MMGQEHIDGLRDLIATVGIHELREIITALEELSDLADDNLMEISGQGGDY